MDYIFGSNDSSSKGRKLQIRIGSNVSSLTLANPNDDDNPHFIDSPYFTGNIVVRVKGFNGIVPPGRKLKSAEEYFGSKKRLFALQVSGRFKHEYTTDDVVFGAEFENKVTPPTGTWVALKFANLIDPALQADVYAEKPWLYSPILCSMNVVNVKEAPVPVSGAAPIDPSYHKLASDKASVSSKASSINILAAGPDPSFKPDKSKVLSCPLSEVDKSKYKPDQVVGKWVWKGEKNLEEDNTLLVQQEDGSNPGFESDAIAERRKYFQKQKVRKVTLFKPDHIYNFEIFAPFIDLNTFDLNLGISINVLQYLNNQPIRLMAKSQSKNIPFFMIEFDLIKDPNAPEDEDENDGSDTPDDGVESDTGGH